MSRLKVMLRGAVISEIELKPEKEYIGGRKDGCDIHLQPEKGISREHFKLKFTDGRWQLQAVSRFGDVFSLGQKVESIVLDHAQAFQIPPYEFQLLDVPEADLTSAATSAISQNFSENEKTVIGVAPQVPYVKVVNTSGEVREMLRLEVGDIWVAGRDPSCQIIIPDQRVSRRQFEIHKVNGIYTIIDLASVNGTFLNGSPVSSTDPQTLKSADLITVLDNQMYFELHDPNFKYKVEKIDIPPITLDQSSDFENAFSADDQIEVVQDENFGGQLLAPTDIPPSDYLQQLPTEIPQIAQDNIGPQVDPGGGPFTGMPPNSDPNQYYRFEQAAQTPSQPPVLTPWQKFTQNKPLVAIVAIIFLVGAYLISENMNNSDKKIPNQAVNGLDPFTKLTPAQQNEIKDLYTLVDQMLTQQKYDLALEKLNKIHEILPTGYKDSIALKSVAQQSIDTLIQKKKDEEIAKEKEENAKKIAEIASKCQKLLSIVTITSEQMRECLAPMALIDPTAPEYVRLMAETEKIEKDRQVKEAENKNADQLTAQLKEMFALAEKTQHEGFAFKAIKQYKLVEKSTFPDPLKLKVKAAKRIEFIQEKITEKSLKGISEAEVLYKDGKLKQAVLSLRETLVYDPENQKIKEHIETYTQELRRQVRLLYQESIIDESYGLVDSTETKQGAKEKWKKITELDLDDDEYFRKAVIKLKRYGVL